MTDCRTSTSVVSRPTTAHQRQQSLDVRDIGRSGIAAQRDAVGINQDVLLDARTPAIRRVFAAALDTAEGPSEGAIEDNSPATRRPLMPQFWAARALHLPPRSSRRQRRASQR